MIRQTRQMTPKVHGAVISKSPHLSAAKKTPLLELFLTSVVATPLRGVLMISKHGSSDGAQRRGYIARFPSKILRYLACLADNSMPEI
jgi:hypothetical protein